MLPIATSSPPYSLFPPSEGVQFSRVFCSPSEGAQSPGALCSACAHVFVSSCLFPPSEGVQFSRVFRSPSEGARLSGALCRACAHVFVSSCLFPPSEGVLVSHVFCSPSEGAQSSGTLCRACTRVFVSGRLFPPSEGVPFSRVFASPSEGGTGLDFLPSAVNHLKRLTAGRRNRNVLLYGTCLIDYQSDNISLIGGRIKICFQVRSHFISFKKRQCFSQFGVVAEFFICRFLWCGSFHFGRCRVKRHIATTLFSPLPKE